MANVRSWVIPIGTAILIAVALVALDGLIFGRATMLSHLAFWPVLLLVVLFVGGGVYFWLKDDKPFGK